MESIIELVPVFKEKIWGGRKLETEFGYEIPAGYRILTARQG